MNNYGAGNVLPGKVLANFTIYQVRAQYTLSMESDVHKCIELLLHVRAYTYTL